MTSVYDRHHKNVKRSNPKFPHWKIPKNNVIDMAKRDAINRGSLWRCPICKRYTTKNKDFLAFHIQEEHPKELTLIMGLFEGEKDD